MLSTRTSCGSFYYTTNNNEEMEIFMNQRKMFYRATAFVLSVLLLGSSANNKVLASENEQEQATYFNEEGQLTKEGETAVKETAERVTVVDEGRYEEIDKLLQESSQIYIKLNRSDLTSEERKELLNQQDIVQSKLQALGVNNERTEFNLVENPGNIENYASTPGYNYDSRFRVHSYYQDVLLDGKNYRMYVEVVTDSGHNKLSYQDSNEVIVEGTVSSEKDYSDFWKTVVKFTANSVAGHYLNDLASFAFSEFLDYLLPEQKENLLIYGGDTIVTIDNFSVNEEVKYIYFYEESKDQWLLVSSSNRFYLGYVFILNYNNGITRIDEYKDINTIVFLDYNKHPMNFIISYALALDQFGGVPLNGIYNKVTMNLQKYNQIIPKKTFILHGELYPYILVYY